jgi:hypothetical protein
MTTLEDLANSNLKYRKNDGNHELLTEIEYQGLERLDLEVFECPDIYKCLERLFTQGDIAVVSRKIEAQYVASQIDLPDGKLLCSLDEYLLPSNQAMHVFKGDRPYTWQVECSSQTHYGSGTCRQALVRIYFRHGIAKCRENKGYTL